MLSSLETCALFRFFSELKSTTAGIATKRPIAVATKASEIPAMTLSAPSAVLAAKSSNALIIPNTVPKRPIKGALEPVVPMTINPLSSLLFSK